MKKIEKMFFWSAVMGFVVIFIWFGMLIFAGEWIYSFHSGLWQMNQLISKELFMSANFIGIGLWKMAVILFFGIPWLAMKIVGDKSQDTK